ncbi:MAG: acetyl-CoA C-acyltransferase [Deltaproteobacteria bacterium]|nr:acetyl-CoA C-acyltransferase [Deltaproteobacteria bacterium]
MSTDVVILSAKRTAIGTYLGALKSVPATRLGSVAASAALAEAKLPEGTPIDEVYVGNVLPANEGQAPARQVALGAGIARNVPCTTVNKVCGSGLKAVMLAAQAVHAGDAEVVVAGGIESMSNVPYYLQGVREGLRLGDGKLIDGLVRDGLWDPYNDFHMGSAAELCAKEHGISREDQDAFAKESYQRALAAQAEGVFKDEICPVETVVGKERVPFIEDEEPKKGRLDRFASLRPVFDPTGTVTAANASSLNDGAAMLVVASAKFAERHGLKPLAKILGYGGAAQAPEWFTTAPALAIEKTLEKLSLGIKDIDLFEINEAFSVVSIVNERLLKLDRSRVNVYGGAVSLGHPIGASGARILVTLLHAMRRRQVARGLASLCIGGGEAVAVVVERM